MKPPRHAQVTLLAVLALTLCAPVAPAQTGGAAAPQAVPAAHVEEAFDVEAMKRFLLTAEITDVKTLSTGITRPRRMTLTDGTRTHYAVFQVVDEMKPVQRFSTGKIELNFRDSYHFNIAAFEVARLVGLDDMVPVAVERRVNQEIGSFAWWVTHELDEKTRREKNLDPPDPTKWRQLWDRMRVFRELVDDTDRNQTNLLITKDWHLWMVDFSRAFRPTSSLRSPDSLLYCDRALLARLRALDKDAVTKAVGRHLDRGQISALMKRRDEIVKRFDRLIKERGEDLVLF